MAASVQNIFSSIPPQQIGKEVQDLLYGSRKIYDSPIPNYTGVMDVKENKLQQEAYNMAHDYARGNSWRPFVTEAQELARRAQQSYPEQYQNYMNPYENAVAKTVSSDVARNFTENILPSLESHFLKRGQHGSSKHRQMVERAHRDMQSELMSRLGQIRAHGYEMGGRQFDSQQGRLATLANLIAGLGGQSQAARIADIGTLQDVGGARHQIDQSIADRKRDEWLRQEAIPMDRLMMRHAILQGLPFATSQMTSQATPPPQRLNTAGKLGSLAMALLGANRKGMLGGMFG